MPIDITQLSVVLSAIASTGKIIESSLNLFSRGISPKYDVLKVEAEEFVKTQSAKDNIRDLEELAANMPEGRLEVISTSIDELDERINQILGNLHMDRFEKERRIKEEQRHICWYVVQVDSCGPLTDTLYRVWINNNCPESGYALKRTIRT